MCYELKHRCHTACDGLHNSLYCCDKRGHMTKLTQYDNLDTAQFITFSCYHKYQLLIEIKPKNIFLKHLKEVCIKYNINILGYVIMPEHVHLVLYPNQSVEMGLVIGEIKSKSAREILLLFKSQKNSLLTKLSVNDRLVFWQKRCYDHNCRSIDIVKDRINYCHKIPVTKGLALTMEDWKFSSYRWYKNMDEVKLEIDGIEL